MDYNQSNYISGVGYQNIIFSKSWNRSFYNKLKFNHKFNDKNELSFNLDFNNDYVFTEDTVTKQAYEKQLNEFVMFLSFNKQIKERLGLSLMARKYVSSIYNLPISPFGGIEYLINKKHNISAKLNISKNYKAPNLNDLYWQPGGNLELQPEENLTTDLALLINKKYKHFNLKSSVTAFYSDVDNWIIWIPSPMGYWTPENIANIISQGVECQINISFKISDFKIVAIGNYAYTDAKNYGDKEIWGDQSYGKQLAYIPVHSGNVFISLNRWNYTLSYTHNSYSERYTTSSNDISLRDWLYPYYMNNVSLSKNFTLKEKYLFEINFKVYNLFNEEYRSILGRPMPGRNYLLSLKFEF
jgi:iron complex outermembrane receptor protein